jgi:hypothetical protein
MSDQPDRITAIAQAMLDLTYAEMFELATGISGGLENGPPAEDMAACLNAWAETTVDEGAAP